MDHAVVKRLRSQVGDRLAEQRRLDGVSGGPPMSAGHPVQPPLLGQPVTDLAA